jgi:hypothetical protein
MTSPHRSCAGPARQALVPPPAASAGGPAAVEDLVFDPDRASSLLADVYSPNRLHVLGPRSAFRMRWRRDALGSMLLSTLSFDAEVELQQQAPQSFYLVSTQLRGHLRRRQALQRRQPAAARAAVA